MRHLVIRAQYVSLHLAALPIYPPARDISVRLVEVRTNSYTVEAPGPNAGSDPWAIRVLVLDGLPDGGFMPWCITDFVASPQAACP